MLISERWKKLQTKNYKETNLMNMSKSGKSTFFHHIFVNNFLCVNFFATFSTVLKFRNSAFFDIKKKLYSTCN
jgi:hypothetical protein